MTCSQRCRQARHRVARWMALESPRDPSSAAAAGDGSCSSGTRRFAYADPPYPGKASLYYGSHPDYAGEVDHRDLLSRLATYDGWALSTSAEALPGVLAAVAQDLPVRVAAWMRGARPHTTARYAVNAWEPVVYVPVPSRPAAADGTRREDALVCGVSPLVTLPGRVVGTKPAAFCRWVFDLMGATPRDTLDDLYPGSGIVGKSWALFRAGAAVEHDGSRAG